MYGFSRNDLLHVYLQKCYLSVIIYSQHFIGNCEEELPEKPISPLSVDCRPTGDYRQVTKRLIVKKRLFTVPYFSLRL